MSCLRHASGQHRPLTTLAAGGRRRKGASIPVRLQPCLLLLHTRVTCDPGAAHIRPSLETVVTEAFRDTLAGFQRTLSFLGLPGDKFHEDDYNGILTTIVESRLEGIFGWQAHEQLPGGFTSAGYAGRRDFVLRRRGVDIAVFEALKSGQPNDLRLEEHLHKLFAYSATNLFFHITYSVRKRHSEMIDAVKSMAMRPPTGTDYLGQTPIPDDGARPAALRGAYRRAGSDVTVIFLLVDMLQVDQRPAVGAPELSWRSEGCATRSSRSADRQFIGASPLSLSSASGALSSRRPWRIQVPGSLGSPFRPSRMRPSSGA